MGGWVGVLGRSTGECFGWVDLDGWMSAWAGRCVGGWLSG